MCRVVEEEAAHLKAQQKRVSVIVSSKKATARAAMALAGRVETPVPLWKAARFAMLGLGAVAVALALGCADRYPLSSIPGSCAPCVCNEAGVLQGCPYHAELKDPVLWISGRGVTAVQFRAFSRNEIG